MNKTRLYGYVCDFSTYYDGIDVDDIWDIHKYLIKKSRYEIIFAFIKKRLIGLLYVYTLVNFI